MKTLTLFIGILVNIFEDRTITIKRKIQWYHEKYKN
jgi:ribosomal protein S17